MSSAGFREKRKLAQKAEILVKFETKERYNNIRQILKKDPSLRNEEELQLMANSQEIVQEIQRRVQRQELVKRRVEEVEKRIVAFVERLFTVLLISIFFIILYHAGTRSALCVKWKSDRTG